MDGNTMRAAQTSRLFGTVEQTMLPPWSYRAADKLALSARLTRLRNA